ncbi:hypothetical protein ACUP6R_003984 [Vibrio navarrensis]
MTPLESTLLSVLLTVFSGASSWMMADYYAKSSSEKESAKLIDRIGEQSSEKILNQSRQLWNIENYLESKRKELSNDPANSEQYEFIGSIIEMIRLVRSSNNTYLSDWAGVTSEAIKYKIDSQSRAQSELFEDIDLLLKSDFDDVDVKNRIISNSKKLPSYLAPSTSNYDGKKISIVRTEYKRQDVNVSQGKMTVYVSQPVYNFTCTGRLEPEMQKKPSSTRARVDGKPRKCPEFNISCSAGTTFDFHVHIKSKESNVYLPMGLYVISFIVESGEGKQRNKMALDVIENKDSTEAV